MNKLKGVIAVVPTPLTKTQDIDVNGIKNLLDFLSKYKISLFALGSAGEAMNLTFEDRVIVAKSMAKFNNKRLPLLIGAGGFGIKEILNFIDKISGNDIDGIHAIPYDIKISPNNIKNFYKTLADKSEFPIWIYQNTTRGNGIPLDIIAELSTHNNIHGIKIAGFDLRTNQSIMNLNSDNFQVFGSADSQFFSFITHGLNASSSSSAACFPELFEILYKAIQSKNLEYAQKVNNKISNFLKTIPRGAYFDNGESSSEVKFMLNLRGVCSEYVAQPYRDQNKIEKKIAIKAFDKFSVFLKSGNLDDL